MHRLVALIFFFGFVNSITWAQLPESLILIRGRVFEQVGNTIQAAKKLALYLPSHGDCVTDDDGMFEAKIPNNQSPLRIEIREPGYRIMQPRNGDVLVDQAGKGNTTVKLQIVILQEGSDFDLTNYNRIQDRLDRLEKDKNLTRRQLNQMNKTLLDTVMFFENQIIEQQKNAKQLLEANRENAAEMESVRAQIDVMNDSLEGLMDQLFVALEEKYLRQLALFNEVSNNLNEYTSSIKDMRDYLVRMDMVFSNQEFAGHFQDVIIDYNKLYERVNRDQESHVQAIGHYWLDPSLSEKLEDLYHTILENIHKETILPLNDEDSVFGIWQKAASQKHFKPKRASKIAKDTVKRLDELISELDEQREIFLTDFEVF
ncbi:MAG: hypothetical protein OEM26_17840 [Saprospiraceae bacterium]|nr:hypothetical protein [Saprospiraceae bacterium]